MRSPSPTSTSPGCIRKVRSTRSRRRRRSQRLPAIPAIVGIISVEEEGRGPLTVPVWYAYDVGGDCFDYAVDDTTARCRCV